MPGRLPTQFAASCRTNSCREGALKIYVPSHRQRQVSVRSAIRHISGGRLNLVVSSRRVAQLGRQLLLPAAQKRSRQLSTTFSHSDADQAEWPKAPKVGHSEPFDCRLKADLSSSSEAASRRSLCYPAALAMRHPCCAGPASDAHHAVAEPLFVERHFNYSKVSI